MFWIAVMTHFFFFFIYIILFSFFRKADIVVEYQVLETLNALSRAIELLMNIKLCHMFSWQLFLSSLHFCHSPKINFIIPHKYLHGIYLKKKSFPLKYNFQFIQFQYSIKLKYFTLHQKKKKKLSLNKYVKTK